MDSTHPTTMSTEKQLTPPEPRSKWVNKYCAAAYPRGGITILEIAEGPRVKYYRDGHCQVYSASVESFHNSYRPATEEELNAEPLPELAYFCFDEGPMILGFSYGTRWNGWGCPLVEKESFRRWLEAMGDVFSPEDGHMRFEGDKLINHDPYAVEDGRPPDTVMTSSPLIYEDRTYEVYDVSNGWCWNQYDWDDTEARYFNESVFEQVVIPEGLENAHLDYMAKRAKILREEEE